MEDKWKQSFKSALSDYEGEGVDLSWDEVWDAYDSTRKKRILPVALYWAAAAAAAGDRLSEESATTPSFSMPTALMRPMTSTTTP